MVIPELQKKIRDLQTQGEQHKKLHESRIDQETKKYEELEGNFNRIKDQVDQFETLVA